MKVYTRKLYRFFSFATKHNTTCQDGSRAVSNTIMTAVPIESTYSGKLSREKTSRFVAIWNIFSMKVGGMASFGSNISERSAKLFSAKLRVFSLNSFLLYSMPTFQVQYML